MVDTTKITGFEQKTLGDKCVSPITGKTYTLKFIDDFDGDKIDETVWTPDQYNSAGGELQAYVKENIVVKDSILHLVAKKEKNVRHFDGGTHTQEAEYTSGKIITRGKYSYKYGRCEMWAKLPKGDGVWPAFWSMGVERGWPWGGEIDIMEIVGGNDQWGNVHRDGQFLASLHWCAPEVEPKDAWETGKGVHHTSFGMYDLPNRQNGQVFGEEYHLFGCEWTKDKIVSYVDDMKIAEHDLTDETMREAFHQEHFLLLNFAMGGHWAGPVNDADFPNSYDIDWVKVWQED